MSEQIKTWDEFLAAAENSYGAVVDGDSMANISINRVCDEVESISFTWMDNACKYGVVVNTDTSVKTSVNGIWLVVDDCDLESSIQFLDVVQHAQPEERSCPVGDDMVQLFEALFGADAEDRYTPEEAVARILELVDTDQEMQLLQPKFDKLNEQMNEIKDFALKGKDMDSEADGDYCDGSCDEDDCGCIPTYHDVDHKLVMQCLED